MIRFGHDDRGATAIEYAIIGALIGIGLIGSLVGTKTSLNAIFGVASTQIGSAGSSQGPGYQRAPYWAAKALMAGYPQTVSQPADGLTTKTYNYQDGSSVVYTYQSTGSINKIQISDTAAKTSEYLQISDSAGALDYNYTTFYDRVGGQTQIYSREVGYNSGNPPMPLVETSTYNLSGTRTNYTYGNPQGADLANYMATYTDMQYFSGKLFVPPQ